MQGKRVNNKRPPDKPQPLSELSREFAKPSERWRKLAKQLPSSDRLRELAKQLGLPESNQLNLDHLGLASISLPDDHPLVLVARDMRALRDREFERELEAALQEAKPKKRGGVKPKLSPDLIAEAQADLRTWGKPLRPYAPAFQHVVNFFKRKNKNLVVDKKQFKTIVRWIIVPLLPENQKPKKRQRKTKP